MKLDLNMLASFSLSFVILAIAISVHEFAHAWTANRLGDTTAKYSGRLTLNPLAHIDLYWTFLLPLVLFIYTSGSFVFGAAKPVPISYWNLNNPKRDIILVGLSGPLANFILAVAVSVVLRSNNHFMPIGTVLEHLVIINVLLGVFNLIPIPPLDGSCILMGVLPRNMAVAYARIEPFGFIILILLLIAKVLDYLIWPLVGYILMLLGIQ